jgi:hypothetical protein
MINGTKLRIWTHKGRAHLDDLIACALLILRWAMDRQTNIKDVNLNDIEINRVSPDSLPKDLNPGEFIVDTGLEFNGVNKFDHHQLDHDVCAAHLVAEKFFPALLRDYQWSSVIKAMDTIDCQGLAFYEAKHGTKVHSTLAHAWLFTDIFREDPVAAAMMYARGLEIKIRYLEVGIPVAEEWVRTNHKLLRIKVRENLTVHVLEFPRDPRLDGVDETAFTNSERKFCKDWGARVIYGWDSQSEPGTVRALYRAANRDKLFKFDQCDPENLKFVSEYKITLEHTPGWVDLIKKACEVIPS